MIYTDNQLKEKISQMIESFESEVIEFKEARTLHLAVDFISGMTDSYAVNLYEELTGIKLPR